MYPNRHGTLVKLGRIAAGTAIVTGGVLAFLIMLYLVAGRFG